MASESTGWIWAAREAKLIINFSVGLDAHLG